MSLIYVIGEMFTEIYFARSPLFFLFSFNIPAIFLVVEISQVVEITKVR